MYLASLADVEAKSNAHRKLIGVAGKEAQAKQKEEAVQTAQETADASKLEFEKVTERLLTEFELFKVYKANDLKQYISDFVKLQVGHIYIDLGDVLFIWYRRSIIAVNVNVHGKNSYQNSWL